MKHLCHKTATIHFHDSNTFLTDRLIELISATKPAKFHRPIRQLNTKVLDESGDSRLYSVFHVKPSYNTFIREREQTKGGGGGEGGGHLFKYVVELARLAT